MSPTGPHLKGSTHQNRDGTQDELDPPDDEVQVADAGTKSEKRVALPLYSSISKEFKVLEKQTERCDIEGACAGLCRAKVAFIQAYSMGPASQIDVCNFFHGISS